MRRLLPLACLLPGLALAEGSSVDVELQRFVPGSASMPGLDHPSSSEGRLSAGLLGLYLRDPLVLLVDEHETGAVVAQRHTSMLGIAYDATPRLSIRGMLPLSWQWGSEEPRWAGDGFGAGDPALGARYTLTEGSRWSAALRADALLPLGAQDRYLGEGLPRASVGLVAAADRDRLGLHGELGAVFRSQAETDSDLVLSHEATAAGALRFSPAPGRQDLFLGAVGRWALFPGTAGPPSAELLLGSRFTPRETVAVDLGVGRGLSAGYGTSEFRAWFGLQLFWSDLGRGEPELDLELAWTEPVAPPPELAPREEPLRWEEGQLAQVSRSRIEIREPIQFEYDTDRIRPSSRPTLLAVARILEETPQILHVVIEGHASAEGEHDYNYSLSIQRARSIVRALVEAGVHPRRLSCRGMGEVAPVLPGTDETSLAASRRVLFIIAEQLDPLDPLPPAEPWLVPWDESSSAKEAP